MITNVLRLLLQVFALIILTKLIYCLMVPKVIRGQLDKIGSLLVSSTAKVLGVGFEVASDMVGNATSNKKPSEAKPTSSKVVKLKRVK